MRRSSLPTLPANNTISQNHTMGTLLPAGALPSLTISPKEIVTFLAGAGALLVKLGTFDPDRRTTIDLALDAVATARIPCAGTLRWRHSSLPASMCCTASTAPPRMRALRCRDDN